ASVLSATKKSVLFQTKNLRIRTNKGNDTALTFFDTGSGSSFILNEAAARLNLTSAGTTKMSVKRFHESNNFEITVKKYNVQILCLNGDILTVPVKGVDSLVDVMKIPMNQDNQSFVYAKPELLIGIDNYWRFFYAKKAKNGIRYVRTRCGDVLSGPIEAAEDEDDDTNVYINAALPGDEEDENDKWLHKRLNVFFELEGTLGFKDDANATEAEIAQSLFDATVQLKDGRFHVSWPFKTQDVKIPLNINAAIAHVERLYKRLLKNGQIHTYTNVLLAHEEKGFIEQVGPLATTPLRASGGNPTTYLTHRGVERDSATTPLRVVFNCSFKLGTKSISFNDVLYIGPNYI
uniref:DUF1758 domain-containing protein n=1 Tax=Panagrellus redivivus TaxID=6233 RepID=A0A7E4VU51_PANRE